MSTNKSDILILLPAFNEGSVIATVITDIQHCGYQNICIVDDGSSDNTGKIALQKGAIVLTHFINRGAGAAVQTGISFAKENNFQHLILMDSDGQHLPEDIQRLFTKMKSENADIVIGNRFALKTNEIPIHRIKYNQIANIFTNFFCKKNYADTQSGFRLLNRKAIETISLQSRRFGFCSEMLIFADKAKLKVVETPINVLYSDYSMSKGQGLFVGFRTAFDILWRVIFY